MHSLTKDLLLPGIFDYVLNVNLYMFCSSKQSNGNRAPIKAGLRTYTPAFSKIIWHFAVAHEALDFCHKRGPPKTAIRSIKYRVSCPPELVAHTFFLLIINSHESVGHRFMRARNPVFYRSDCCFWWPTGGPQTVLGFRDGLGT